MDKENLEIVVARLDAQLPPLRSEISKLHTKADKIDADQRKTMVLFEDTEGKFKLTLDAYIGLNVKMEHIEQDMMDLKERVTNLEFFVREGFELFSRKLESLSEKIDRLTAPPVGPAAGPAV